MSRLLTDLNKAQHDAVTTTEGPLLVIAGAGSGKTRVLTRRVAHIITERKAEPYQVMAVTFTNKAAGEMRERVAQLLGGEIPALNVSTFHSFCARFLRREAHNIGYEDNFTIFDEDDALTLVKNCLKELNLSGSQFAPRAQRRKISNAKNKLITSEMFAEQSAGYFETRTAEIYKLYQKRLGQCNAMDFDDLLCNTVTLLKDNAEVGERYRRRYHYLLVDEYQDTNHVQYLLLKHLLGEHKNICVVGDEDQSIYGWRGADIRNILDFEKDFPGAKLIKLEQNYRSTATILKAAGAVIRNNDARKEKTLWTEAGEGDPLRMLKIDSAADEAVHVVDFIHDQNSEIPLKETVILYRTNAQSRAFEEELRRRNTPYQIIGGISFYQRKEIKDLMAYLKLIVNPADDVSFQRVVNYPRRGIGQKTIEAIAEMARANSISMYEMVTRADEHPELSRAAKRLKSFCALIEKYRGELDQRPVDLLTQDLVDDLNLIEELKAEDEIVGQTRVENIEAFIEGTADYARSHSEGYLAEYLAEISLFTDLDQYKETEEKVTMMTLHTAKGLEYDSVYIVGLEEGLFPLARTIDNPMELEEERRLFYVGATRAREKLTLSTASTRHRFGEVMSVPSRFIDEIPEELIDKVDRRTNRHYEYDRQSRTPSFFDQPAKQVEPIGVHYEYEGAEMMQPGRLVHHPTFGRGKIVSIQGFGETLRLEISFSGVGIKKIMAKYAKLKVIG